MVFPHLTCDHDLRGVHILPVREVIGLNAERGTNELSEVIYGWEIDLVTHDVKKFFLLLLKKNGYVLEQLYSPLVIHTTPEYEELKAITSLSFANASKSITRHHSHHYLGFAQTQWKLFEKEHPHRIKPLLYVYRVLLTGIYLMRTGKIEANLVKLNEEFNLPLISDLIERKLSGVEKSVLEDDNIEIYRQEYQLLLSKLEEAYQNTRLPENSSCQDALNDLLVRLRLA